MKKSFPWGRTILLGFGFLGISIVWPIFDQFLPLYLQAGNPEFEKQTIEMGQEVKAVAPYFRLSPALALFIMTWDNIINVFIQPWVGERSDRTWNRFGRRKGWILLGLPIAMVGFISIPFAQSILAIAIFILITNFGMSLFRSPTIAWLGDLFEEKDRSKANGVINMMGGIGGFLAYLGGGMLFESFGRTAPFIGGAVATVVALAAALVLVKEPPQIEARKQTENAGLKANLLTVFNNQNKSGLFILLAILFWFMGYSALSASLSSFAYFNLGISAGRASILAVSMTISFILFAIPAGFLAGKWGRRRTIMIGLVGLVLTALTGFIIIQSWITFVAVLVVAGMFWALVNVNSLPMVYDYGDERKIGAYTGLYYFASQSAAVLGPTLGGILVEFMKDYRWIWLYSMVFMALAWLAVRMVQERSKLADAPNLSSAGD